MNRIVITIVQTAAIAAEWHTRRARDRIVPGSEDRGERAVLVVFIAARNRLVRRSLREWLAKGWPS